MQTNELQELVVNSLDDLKGLDIVSKDVSTLTSVTDYMVICTGTSNRHVKSLADNLVQSCKAQGMQPLGVEGTTDAKWVLVDLGDVVAHVMTEESREFYQLEKLWGIVEEKRAAANQA